MSWEDTVAQIERLNVVPKLIGLDSTESTNTVAMSMAQQGAPSGTVVLAQQQHRGRGRMGREWSALPGEHIYLSVVWRPPWPAERASQLTLDAAVSVARCVERWIDGRPRLKWPNDVLIDGRKCAGLLGEMRASSSALDFVVMGIGLNVDAVAHALPESLSSIATAIGDHSKAAVRRQDVACSLVSELHTGYNALLKRGRFDREGWCSYAETLGEEVRVTLPGGSSFVAIAETLSETGTLVVRKSDGALLDVVAGDVVVQRGGTHAAGC